jgi:putative tricarboxylic transport membrane protein
MSFFDYFSDGLGLAILIVVLLAMLLTIGIVVRRSSKKDSFGEILVPSSLIAFSIVFLAITFSFPAEEAGPAAIPLLWSFWTIVLCAAILWQVLHGKAKPDPESGRLVFLLLVTLLLIAYYFAIQTIGYFISSFLFLVLLMHILSYKKKLIIYLIAVGWVAFSYIVFYKLLYIQLPLGYFEYYL